MLNPLLLRDLHILQARVFVLQLQGNKIMPVVVLIVVVDCSTDGNVAKLRIFGPFPLPLSAPSACMMLGVTLRHHEDNVRERGQGRLSHALQWLPQCSTN